MLSLEVLLLKPDKMESILNNLKLNK